MGIPNFLPGVEKTAGRTVDLRQYKGRRVAIDISVWIQRECFANSEMLADEQHLSNFGRAALLEKQRQEGSYVEERQKREEEVQKYVQKITGSIIDDLIHFRESTDSKILVVFDGQTPPVKNNTVSMRKRKRDEEMGERDRPVDADGGSPAMERRYRANRRAGAGQHFLRVIDAVIAALRSQKIAFLVAPYEADAQLAFLQMQGHVDLVITDDSDLIAYGPASPVLYKIVRDEEKHWTRGILIRRSDLGARRPGNKTTTWSLLDLSPAMLAIFFTATGGDYCRKLAGIGVKTVSDAMRELFLPKGHEQVLGAHPIEQMIQSTISASWDRLQDVEKEEYKKDFIAAVFMYRHAVIFDPMKGKCRNMTPLNRPDVELIGYAPYKELIANKKIHKNIIGSVLPPKIATYIAEGWICPKRMVLRQADDTPDEVKRAFLAFKDGDREPNQPTVEVGLSHDQTMVDAVDAGVQTTGKVQRCVQREAASSDEEDAAMETQER